VRTNNSVDLVDSLAGGDIENQDGFEVFGGGEEAVPLEIYFKVVEVSLDVSRELIGLYQPQGLLTRSWCLTSECRYEEGKEEQ
jgi:hypothetical protein